MIKQLLQGMVVGLANIIPGVSGGTMLVAMGLYDKLIHAITHLRTELKEAVKLLLPILLGAAIAIVALSYVFEFLLSHYPIPTNMAFCGLIMGSLPFIFRKVQGKPVTVDKLVPLAAFFALVIVMALLGEGGGTAADVTLNFVNILKLFGVGVVAAATMIVPGVSGSMVLMLLGYYNTIITTIKALVESLVHLDLPGLFTGVGILLPFGIGVIVGIFAVAKLIEIIFEKAETHAYYAIIGLIVASPVAILMNTDWSGFSVLMLAIGAVTFVAGWFVASKLGN